MKKLKKLFTLLTCLLLTVACFAQTDSGKATGLMRSNGRIYVVVAVMLTILAGLILYLVRIDRKISRIEKGN
jgi:hypothetical protein